MDRNHLTVKETVLITGTTGQNNAFMAEFLLEKDYQVHDIKHAYSYKFLTTNLPAGKQANRQTGKQATDN